MITIALILIVIILTPVALMASVYIFAFVTTFWKFFLTLALIILGGIFTGFAVYVDYNAKISKEYALKYGSNEARAADAKARWEADLKAMDQPHPPTEWEKWKKAQIEGSLFHTPETIQTH